MIFHWIKSAEKQIISLEYYESEQALQIAIDMGCSIVDLNDVPLALSLSAMGNASANVDYYIKNENSKNVEKFTAMYNAANLYGERLLKKVQVIGSPTTSIFDFTLIVKDTNGNPLDSNDATLTLSEAIQKIHNEYYDKGCMISIHPIDDHITIIPDQIVGFNPDYHITA